MCEKYTQPVDLFETWVRLHDGSTAEPAAAFSPAAAGSWTVAAFHAADDDAVHADHWERHPGGNEVLCPLSGAVEVYLRDRPDGGDAGEPVATLTAGQVFIVPVGQWHRLAVAEPGDLLAVNASIDPELDPVRDDERRPAATSR